MKKSHFTVKDFVENEDFQSWVLNPNAESEDHWNTWLKEHPGHDELVAEAREIILLLGFSDDPLANRDFIDVWRKIRQDVQLTEADSAQSRRTAWYWRAAAVLVGLAMLTAGYLLYTQSTRTVIYSSGYGEIKHVVLPDNSKVTLNGNSELRLSKSLWNASADREVFLEGEAFFEVTHIETQGQAKKFLVRTSELDVEVLGTAFNVNSRHQETEVILNSGKVQLSIPQTTDTTRLLMAPGDLVTFNKLVGNTVVSKTESPDRLTAWRSNKLIFDGTPLIEIAEILNDTYGLEVKFPSDSLKEKRFKGTFLADDINILRVALTQTYNVEIVDNNQ